MNLSDHRASIVLNLFEQTYHRVYCFCRRSLSPDAAEDIAQEVFVRLLQVERLPEMTITVSYLIKIADNLIKRRYNRNQRFQRFLETKDSQVDTDWNDDPTLSLEEDFSDELSSHLDCLSSGERDAVEMVICKGLSYQEAARCMGVPVSTVNNWKYRGLQKLKDRYTSDSSVNQPMAG